MRAEATSEAASASPPVSASAFLSVAASVYASFACISHIVTHTLSLSLRIFVVVSVGICQPLLDIVFAFVSVGGSVSISLADVILLTEVVWISSHPGMRCCR